MSLTRFKGDPNRVISVARAELGTVEQPINRTEYGEWFGWNGVAWCCIFASWVFWHAGNPFPPIQKPQGIASVALATDHAIKTGQWRSASSGYKPKAGDLVIFKFTTRPDHIGVVVAMLADGRVWTIEGNTNATGSRTGGMVATLYRRTGILGYICIDTPSVNLNELRRWLAGLTLGKLQNVRTKVPTDNAWDQDIRVVQDALNIGKNAGLKVDGVYGPETRMHMADWQNQCRKLGLPINDPVGVMGDSSKWWLCIHLGNIRDGRA